MKYYKLNVPYVEIPESQSEFCYAACEQNSCNTISDSECLNCLYYSDNEDSFNNWKLQQKREAKLKRILKDGNR